MEKFYIKVILLMVNLKGMEIRNGKGIEYYSNGKIKNKVPRLIINLTVNKYSYYKIL